MPGRTLILWLMTVAALTVHPSATVRADSANEREHQIKAAFLYNFIPFVDGTRFDQLGDKPGTPAANPKEPILIGILGSDPFESAFDPLQKKEIKGRSVSIRRFEGFEKLLDSQGHLAEPHPQIDKITECHVLFVCPSEEEHFDVIMQLLGPQPILTVAETPGFLEAGGMINFTIVEKKVRFEINTAAATRAQLKIRSKLLRLARRVITQDTLSTKDEEEREAQHNGK